MQNSGSPVFAEAGSRLVLSHRWRSLTSALHSPSSVKNLILKFYPLVYSWLAGHRVMDAGRRHGQFMIITAVAGMSLFTLVPESLVLLGQLWKSQ